MKIIVLSLILCVLSYHPDSIRFMELSQTSLQAENLIFTNNNTLRNEYWRHNASRIFKYNQSQKSKGMKTIQWYLDTCDKMSQLKRFNKHYTHVHNKGKAIKYGTKIRYKSYNAAPTDIVWLILTYNQTKSTKHGQRQSNPTHTKRLMSFLSSNITRSNYSANNTNNNNVQ